MPPEVQAFLEGLSVWTVIAWIIGLLALIGVAGKLYKLFKALTDFLDDVKGEDARAGVPARPGIMARLETIEQLQTSQGQTLEVVRHELFPNSGKSLRDQTNRMEQKLNADNTRIAELSEQVGAVEEKLSGVDDKVTVLDERVEEHITQSTQIIQELKKEKP